MQILGLLLFAVLVAGCVSGPWYWTRNAATPEQFESDHIECARAATIGYGVGSEQVYKNCLKQKGWTRVQGRGTQPPSVPHFRGIEDDDHFAFTAPQLDQRIRDEKASGREAEEDFCRYPKQYRPPGKVCP